jgi:hypothetical protein
MRYSELQIFHLETICSSLENNVLFLLMKCRLFRIFELRVPEGKRSLGRPRHRWEGNIKIKNIRYGHHLSDGRSQCKSPYINIVWVPKKAGTSWLAE